MSIRRYVSGYSKLKKIELFVKSRKGTMEKFIKINKRMN